MTQAAAHDGATGPVLEMRNISRTFPGVKALDRVQITAWGGEVLALMGENGAGKSTLMKILSGAYHADPGGEIRIGGKPVAITDPIAARRHGIAIIYQELALAPNLSVAENIYLGDELSKGGRIDRKAMYKGCQPVLDRLGAPFRPETTVGRLSIAEQQLVEIARALHTQARIVVLDEPTTALSTRETERLFALVRQLRADGIALIYISHRMAEVYELADRVSVLRDGTYVGTLDRDALSAEALVKMMVGRDLSSFYTKTHDPHGSRGPVVLEVREITDGGRRVRPCSLVLHQGEVLGTINVYHPEPEAFGAEERALLEMIADRAARALHGALLFDRTRSSAMTDPLTGLYNTRFLMPHLEERCRPGNTPGALRRTDAFALLCLDLDSFKPINDLFGHQRGDRVLTDLARIFRECVRRDDIVTRYGGDEFLIVLGGVSAGEAEAIAAKIEAAVARYEPDLVHPTVGPVRLGVSVGVSLFPQDGTNGNTLLSVADARMYRRKAERRLRQLTGQPTLPPAPPLPGVAATRAEA